MIQVTIPRRGARGGNRPRQTPPGSGLVLLARAPIALPLGPERNWNDPRRWYDPALGRFAQADSVGAGDRYAYVLNNPLRYTDPSGHRECDDQWGCEGPPPQRHTPPMQEEAPFQLQEPLTPAQADQLRETATQAAELSGEAFALLIGGSAEEAFEAVHGSFTIAINPAIDVEGTCVTVDPLTTCEVVPSVQTLLHELGHIFDVRYRELSGDTHLASDYLPPLVVGDTEIRFSSDDGVRTDWGYMCAGVPCQASQVYSLSEELADTYMNFVLDPMDFPQNGFRDDVFGQARRDEILHFMQTDWLPDMGFMVVPE